MSTTEYIIPTKESPVFTAECDWFGFIEGNFYKRFLITEPDGGQSCGDTFAIRYHDAIVRLHEWIQENNQVLDEWPKAKFTIRLVDGSWDPRLNQRKDRVVYTISAKKAKELL